MDSQILATITDTATFLVNHPSELIHTHIHCRENGTTEPCMMCSDANGTDVYVLYANHCSYAWSLCKNCIELCNQVHSAIVYPIMRYRYEVVSRQFKIHYRTRIRCMLCCEVKDNAYRNGMSFICKSCKMFGTEVFCIRASMMLDQVIMRDVLDKILVLLFYVILD